MTATATATPVAAAAAQAARLKITEIFVSLQGESTYVGLPTVFVRLTGCPLRCQYCDTAYAFHGGHWKSLDEIVDQTRAYGVRHVCVTGGEPLAQRNCRELLQRLCDAGLTVSLETSGALDVAGIDHRVARIVDIKTPDSGESQRMLWDHFEDLTTHDQVKFVICSRNDYDWARGRVDSLGLVGRCEILLSPSHQQVSPRELADWIVADRLPVRMQVQMHKQLWGDVAGK